MRQRQRRDRGECKTNESTEIDQYSSFRYKHSLIGMLVFRLGCILHLNMRFLPPANKIPFDRRFIPYIFPALVLFALLIATTFKISGSSIAVYEYFLGEDVQKNLLVGQPRTVRSDEWAVNTPFVISQVNDNFPEFSSDIGQGQDMSVVVDVPYRDWSSFFKPQNLVFFILPVDYAFAFKWWLLATTLLLAVYFFVLAIYPKRYMLATLVSVAFFMSPFIQWWYQTITLLPIAYALLSVAIAIRLIQSKRYLHSTLWGALLSYILICFTLTMYPAFQIIVALFALTIFTVITFRQNLYKYLMTRRILIAVVTVLISTALVAGIYVYQHLDIIQSIQSTVYPGERNVQSGGFDPLLLFIWPLSYLALDGGPSTVFGGNQSEISGFLLVGYVSLPLLLLAFREKGSTSLSQLERTLLVVLSLFTLILLVRMLIPLGDYIFSIFGLNKIPHVRLLLAFGLINMTLIAITVGRAGEKITRWRSIISRNTLVWFVLVFASLFISLVTVQNHFNLVAVGAKELLAVSLTFAVICAALFHKVTAVRYAGLLILIAVSLLSAGPANPLYRGLGAFDNELTQYVSDTEKRDSSYWVAVDSPILSSLLVSTGAEIAGGVNTHPQIKLWKESFPDNSSVYNRYAHIRFVIDDTKKSPQLELVQSDSFKVHVSSCDPLLKKLGIGYLVTDVPSPQGYICTKLDRHLIVGKKPITVLRLHNR